MSLILITILLIIFAIISLKNLAWSLYLIIFLLPTYLIHFQIFSIPLTFLEGMILVLFLVWVIKEIRAKNLFKLIKNLPQCKFFIPIILLIFASTISIFISFNFNAAAGIWKAYFIEPLLLFLVFINTIKSEKQINKVIWSLSLSAFIVSAIAILQYLTNFAIPTSYNLPNIKRATSIYDYPSAVGLYIAPILTLLMGYFILKYKNISSKIKLILVSTITILTLSLLFAKTEGAIIALLIATFFILMFTKWKWWTLFNAIGFGLFLLIIPQTKDYIITLLTFQDVSGDVRLTLWQGTLRLIKNHPIFGAGLAGFPYLYEQYKEAKHVEISLYPHNIFLNFWVETGILGLIAFIWIIINYFKEGFKNLNYKLLTTNYSLILIAVMICFLIYGLVDAPYFKNDLSCLFWIWIGLLIVVPKTSDVS